MSEQQEKYDEQAAALQMWRAGKRNRAGAMFVQWYTPLVKKWAWNGHLWSGKSMPMDDLEQVGLQAVIEALDLHDETRGHLAATISIRVRGAIMHHVFKANGVLSVANSRRDKNIAMKGRQFLAAAARAGLSDVETREQMGRAFRMEPWELNAWLAMIRGPDQPGLDDRREQMGGGVGQGADEMALLPDLEVPPQIDTIQRSQQDAILERLMDEAKLPERARRLLNAYHRQDEFVSLETIAERENLSRERVRRIIADSVVAMGEAAKRLGLELEDVL